MLSISAMGGHSGDYYLDLAREDYYLAGGEPPGIWMGKGAKVLGLEGQINKDEFRNLFEGYNADGSQRLVQNAGKKSRHPGWDLTFSAPKSVSVLWSQSEPEDRDKIQQAHHAAVKAAIEYLETNAVFTKRERFGVEREQALGLVVATFEHGTSRAQDPQLHTHALVLNMATRDDGSTGTLIGHGLFDYKMVAGAIYRAELGHQLQSNLDVVVQRRGTSFEIGGISALLTDKFSTRRKAILEQLDEWGAQGARASAAATLATREVKGHMPRETLLQEWQQSAAADGFSLGDVWKQKTHAHLLQHQADKNQVHSEILTHLTTQQSSFSEKQFIRTCAERFTGEQLSADHIIANGRHYLATSNDVVRLGARDGQSYFSSKTVIELEEKLLVLAVHSKTERNHIVPTTTIEQAITTLEKRNSISLSTQQKEALEHITAKSGSIQVVEGMAGTGKTTLLQAARLSWEAEGLQVYGASLSGKASSGLENESGIRSCTVAKLLNRSTGPEIDQSRLQTPYELNRRSVLVVDEAGMLSTRDLHDIITKTQATNAKLVLVGDSKQLQPIETGGGFKSIANELGSTQLTEIRRQNEEWARQTVRDVSQGKTEEVLQSFAQRGLLEVKQTPQEAREALIRDWKQTALQNPKESLILTSTRREAKTLNRMAQHASRELPSKGERHVKVRDERFFEGDRVLFTQTHRGYGVQNGSLGTVVAIHSEADVLTVRLDDGKLAKVDTEFFQHLELGYAVTTHKAQGATVERAFVHLESAMQGRELFYVQTSRARTQTKLYTDEHTAGDKLSSLSRQTSRSQEKELAIKLFNQPEQGMNP